MNTIEAGWAKEYDGRNVFAVLKVPNDIFLYVDENLLEIPTDRTYTSDRLPYRYGTPISSAEDLYKFMTAQEPFADTTANYVLTNNVNMKNSPIPQDSFLSKLTANGSFEGDYHTISYMDKPLLYGMYGKSSVQNLIIQNADINLTNGTSGACITSRTEGEDVSIKNVFLIDSDLYSNWDTGYIIGGTIYGSASVSNVGAVGGSVTAGRALGGLTGNAGNYAGSSSHYKNVFLLNLEFGSYGSQGASGMVGYLGEGKVTIDNIYVAYQNFKSINVVGNYPQGTTLTNSFFDSTIMPTAITTGFDGKVLGKTSYEMTTSDLFNGSGDWENKEGYYPRLTWIRNHPVVSLYTATRGAFTSVDNQTNNTDMFNGNINGTIKIPEELQKKRLLNKF